MAAVESAMMWFFEGFIAARRLGRGVCASLVLAVFNAVL
jgi:hypothetical protein